MREFFIDGEVYEVRVLSYDPGVPMIWGATPEDADPGEPAEVEYEVFLDGEKIEPRKLLANEIEYRLLRDLND